MIGQSRRHRRCTRPPHLSRATAIGRLGNQQGLAHTRTRQAEIVVGVVHYQLLAQAILALAQGIDSSPHRRHALTDIQVQSLHKGSVGRVPLRYG